MIHDLFCEHCASLMMIAICIFGCGGFLTGLALGGSHR